MSRSQMILLAYKGQSLSEIVDRGRLAFSYLLGKQRSNEDRPFQEFDPYESSFYSRDGADIDKRLEQASTPRCHTHSFTIGCVAWLGRSHAATNLIHCCDSQAHFQPCTWKRGFPIRLRAG